MKRLWIACFFIVAASFVGSSADAACPCVPPYWVTLNSYCSQPDICRGPQDLYHTVIDFAGTCEWCVFLHQDSLGGQQWRNFRPCSNVLTGSGNCTIRCAELFRRLPLCQSSDQCSDPPSGPGGVIPERLVSVGNERWRIEEAVSTNCLRVHAEDAAHATTWKGEPLAEHATPHGVANRLLRSGIRGPIDLVINGARAERFGGADGAAMLRLDFTLVEGLPHATELVVCVP